jgi:hypothetical protein
MLVRSSQWKKVSQEVVSAALAYHEHGDIIDIRSNSLRAVSLFAFRPLFIDCETYVRTCDPSKFHSYHFTLHTTKLTTDCRTRQGALELLE